MEPGAGSRWDRRRLIGLATIGLVGVGIFVAGALGPPWFFAFFPPSRLRRIVVRLLEAAQVGYGVLLLIVSIAAIALIVAIARARRRGTRRGGLIRGLAVCLALIVSMALAEGVSAAWLAWTRVPMPWLKTRFPAKTDPNRLDILVLGESSAVGVPYDKWFSTPRIVAWKLHEAFSNRTFHIEYLARPGLTLDKVHFWMKSMEHRPDLVILYAGHNEFQGRYNWGHAAHHYLDESPPPRETLASFAGAHSPVCRLIQDTIGIYRVAIPPPRVITRQLVDMPVYTAVEYAERVHDFRTRLEAMVSYCEGLGALVVLVPPPGNDADYDPSRSFLPPRALAAERDAFARAFNEARQLEASDPARAIAAYRAVLARHSDFADAHYRLARLLEAAGQQKEANLHYIAARDTDGFPMRCQSDFLNAYDEVAGRHPRAILVDALNVFRKLSARGIAGDEFFTDGLHPSLIGYTELAQAILTGLHARRALGWPESAPPPVVTPAECAAHFEMDNARWIEICEYAVWFYDMTSYIRYDPSARQDKAQRFREAKRQLEAGKRPESLGIPGIGTERPGAGSH
jgi:lysophospholipase L1-like esterase